MASLYDYFDTALTTGGQVYSAIQAGQAQKAGAKDAAKLAQAEADRLRQANDAARRANTPMNYKPWLIGGGVLVALFAVVFVLRR